MNMLWMKKHQVISKEEEWLLHVLHVLHLMIENSRFQWCDWIFFNGKLSWNIIQSFLSLNWILPLNRNSIFVFK